MNAPVSPDRSALLAAPSPVMMLERANDNLSAALQYPSDAQHVMRCVEVARELISHVIVANNSND